MEIGVKKLGCQWQENQRMTWTKGEVFFIVIDVTSELANTSLHHIWMLRVKSLKRENVWKPQSVRKYLKTDKKKEQNQEISFEQEKNKTPFPHRTVHNYCCCHQCHQIILFFVILMTFISSSIIIKPSLISLVLRQPLLKPFFFPL